MKYLIRTFSAIRPAISSSTTIRTFSLGEGGIPSNEEHTVGRQRAEEDKLKEGITLFNRDPIVSDETEGNSKDNPILVPSFEQARPVGICHNDSSYISWFILQKGKVHYLPSIEKYFALYHPEEMAEAIKEFKESDVDEE